LEVGKLRLRILAIGALAFLCLSFIIWLRKKPNLVEYELAGHKFLLDSRIRVMRAEDWGMGWTIRPGDWILWVKLENRPKEGDIVLFRGRDGRLIAHRVLSTNPLITGGDNSGPDNYPVKPLGIVIGVSYGS
jgi:hypothetical protein